MKSTFRLLSVVLSCLLLIISASCTSGPDMLKYASAEDAIIITGSASDILKNAGAKISGDVITLTPKLKQLFDTDLDRISFGIDPAHCIVTANQNADCLLMGASLKSKSTFEKAIATREGVYRTRTERDGMIIYSLGGRRSQHIVVTDDMVFMVSAIGYDEIEPDVAVRQAIGRASASPLASWQRSILEGKNTMNMLLNVKAISSINDALIPVAGFDSTEVSNGFVRLTANLEGSKLKCSGQIYSASGNVLSNSFLTRNIDPSMLRYVSDDAVAAMAFAVSPDTDWDKVLSSAAGTPYSVFINENKDIIVGVLEKISGTVMISVAPGQLVELATPQGWGVSLSAQLREGAAAEFVNNLYDFCQNESVPVTRTDNGFDANIPGLGTIRVNDDKGVFVITNLAPSTPMGDCKYLSKSDFSDCTGSLVLRGPKEHPIISLTNLDFGVELTYKATADEVDLQLQLTDTKSPLLESLLNSF